MQHIHLQECPSTQTLLREKFADLSQPILVSTDLQTEGFGRKGSDWSHFGHALAFSFTLSLNETLTLTPLEIGCLLAEFFSPNLFVKWPNDLINANGEKVGGILCQLVGKNLVVGIGLNLYLKDQKLIDYPIGGIFTDCPQFEEDFKKVLPKKISTFIRENRLTSTLVEKKFRKYCCHMTKEVTIIDGSIKKSGQFIGISPQGEALLKNINNETIKVLTGSLRF